MIRREIVKPILCTMLARAANLSCHRNMELRILPEYGEADICKEVSKLLNSDCMRIQRQRYSVDELNDLLMTQLQECSGKPWPLICSLQSHGDASRSLEWLETSNIIQVDLINSPLVRAGLAFGVLCYRNKFSIPDDMTDEELPDATEKLALVEFGRVLAVEESALTRIRKKLSM